MLIQALVSVAHSHCFGRESGGLTDFAEEYGDALLDDGSKQLSFYFAIWRFDGEMWAQRLEGQSQREHARVLGAFSGVHTTLATGNWAWPSPAVSASTVTSQSYSVNYSSPQISQAPFIVTQDTLLWNTPRAWYSFNILFLFVFFLFYCSFVHRCYLNVG